MKAARLRLHIRNGPANRLSRRLSDFGGVSCTFQRRDGAARRLVGNLSLPFDYLSVVALGSYGRLEAHADASDFEWLLIFDDRKVNSQEATVAQAALTSVFANQFGRVRLSINKTFGQLCDFSDLGTVVGGLAETNQMLTYRILTLTEGLPLSPGGGHDRVLAALAHVYAASHTAGHRLLSLATELARYYRTVRASYKHKVDEEGKPWAVRAIKNRSYRRFAFVSSALQFVVAGPRINYSTRKMFDLDEVAAFIWSMRQTPSERLLTSLSGLHVDRDVVSELLRVYEQIHACGSPILDRRSCRLIFGSEALKIKHADGAGCARPIDRLDLPRAPGRRARESRAPSAASCVDAYGQAP
jgi:hypothetical protein